MFDINVDIKKLNDPEKLAQKVRILQRKNDRLEDKVQRLEDQVLFWKSKAMKKNKKYY